MGFKRKFFKNTFTFAGYSYTTKLLGFVSSIILSRFLLPAEYGYVALITVFTGFVGLFSDTGISFALIRSDYGRTYHHALNNLALWIGILLFILMIILSYPISLFYSDSKLISPIIILSSIFIFKGIILVPLSLLKKELNFNAIGQIRLKCAIFNFLLMILFAYLGFSYWTLIIPHLITELLRYLLYIKKTKFYFKFYGFKHIKVAFKKTKSLIGNIAGFNLVNYWARNSDNLIIGKFYGAADLGIYNRAYRLLNLSMSIMTGLFGTVLYPSLKELQSKKGNINKEYNSILGTISLLNFPVAALLIMLPHELVRILWGQNWIEVATLLPYFGLLILIQTLISTAGNVFILLKKEKRFLQLGVICSIFTVSSIILGALFSVLYVARFYAISYLLIVVPIVLIEGFLKIVGFSKKEVFRFWTPKLILCYLIFASIWMNNRLFCAIGLSLYLIHLIIDQRNELLKLINTITKKIAKKRK